jgi:hypothetical protein
MASLVPVLPLQAQADSVSAATRARSRNRPESCFPSPTSTCPTPTTHLQSAETAPVADVSFRVRDASDSTIGMATKRRPILSRGS